MTVRVRPMTVDDVAQVAAIEQAVQPLGGWSVGLFAEELAQPSRHYLVAEDCLGDVLGFGGVMVVVGEAHISTLVVDPAHRRRGIASDLLRELLLHARGCAAEAATLEVRQGNVGALALYRRFGFAPVGMRPGYYPARVPPGAEGAPRTAADNESAVIMWLHDLAGSDVASARGLDELEVGH